MRETADMFTVDKVFMNLQSQSFLSLVAHAELNSVPFTSIHSMIKEMAFCGPGLDVRVLS